MSKRTNNLYPVRFTLSTYLPVEAESDKEAMEIAAKMIDYISLEDFHDGDIEAVSCEDCPYLIESFFLDDDDIVLTADGVMSSKEYNEALENKD